MQGNSTEKVKLISINATETTGYIYVKGERERKKSWDIHMQKKKKKEKKKRNFEVSLSWVACFCLLKIHILKP